MMPKSTDPPAGDGDLWMVVAVIQPFRLDAVTLALESLPGFGGMTVSECQGFGREKLGASDSTSEAEGIGDTSARRRTESVVDFTSKVRIEVAVAGQDRVNTVVEAIARTGHTGNRGDGKVFAWQLARVVRVRTFEEGAVAL